jgi:hypothetical protein
MLPWIDLSARLMTRGDDRLRRASWDIGSPGATLAPALARATDSAVHQQRAASVGNDS